MHVRMAGDNCMFICTSTSSARLNVVLKTLVPGGVINFGQLIQLEPGLANLLIRPCRCCADGHFSSTYYVPPSSRSFDSVYPVGSGHV